MSRPIKPIAVCGLLLLGAAASAQPRPGAGPIQPAAGAAQPGQPGQPAQPGQPGAALTAEELEQLLGPIALYPDPLLANVLAACVYPDEVAQAAAFMRTGGGPQAIESQPWEPPVKAIAGVPEVLRMLGEFPEWTTALGQAYLTQAQDVMATIQSLRQRAQASGALQTTEQQQVVVEQETIYIEPADPEVVYVPSYEPSVVYVDDDDDDAWAAGLIGFGTGVAVGAIWSDLDCDWHHGCIGWGEADIDINREITTGDITIGDRTSVRGEHRARVGQEGAAWEPNSRKPLATNRPDQRALAANSMSAAARPRTSSAARPPSTGRGTRQAAGIDRPVGADRAAVQPAGARRPAGAAPGAQPAGMPRTAAPTSTGPRTAAPRTPPTPGAARPPTPGGRSAYGGVPTPSSQRAQSAYQGGASTRAASSRGSSSRQAASRGSAGPPRAASRGGGGGGRRGGGGGRR